MASTQFVKSDWNTMSEEVSVRQICPLSLWNDFLIYFTVNVSLPFAYENWYPSVYRYTSVHETSPSLRLYVASFSGSMRKAMSGRFFPTLIYWFRWGQANAGILLVCIDKLQVSVSDKIGKDCFSLALWLWGYEVVISFLGDQPFLVHGGLWLILLVLCASRMWVDKCLGGNPSIGKPRCCMHCFVHYSENLKLYKKVWIFLILVCLISWYCLFL